MEAPSFNLSFNLGFWDRYRVSRALQQRLWSTWLGYAFFVGVPIAIFVVALIHHWDLSRRGAFDLPGWAILLISCAFMFVFNPLLQVFQLWSASRRSRTLFGMQHQALTSEGVTSSGPAFNTTLGWDAIHKVIETRRYFFLFFSARGAFFIPKAHIRSDSDLAHLRSVLKHYLHERAHLNATA